MKKIFATSIFYESFSPASSYLNYFKTIDIKTASLNLQKSKKEFYIKLYTKLKKEQKSFSNVSVNDFSGNLVKKNIIQIHFAFYRRLLEKRHLFFLANAHNKKLFSLTNFSAYESVKQTGYNARYNKILSFDNKKLPETKIQTYKHTKV